ncbi:hypothetical protein [Maricaulis sp.]|uniref:hypothetical protein n=1 Tax=Maricaulis sp. TaxID=1486257 RepID=UPI0026314ED8|nr:hypothetical protein [Maricaulis sp.]
MTRTEIPGPRHFAIELRDDEKALCEAVEFEALRLQHGYPAKRNGEMAAQLVALLTERDAIPECRLNWFVDPAYNVGGRGQSRRETFERNGCTGRDILEHPHFLPYLRYFIWGPQLPAPAIEGFCDAIDQCFGHITSSDISTLSTTARKLFRASSLDRRFAAEEFFKLAIECGVPLHYAPIIRDAIMRAR